MNRARDCNLRHGHVLGRKQLACNPDAPRIRSRDGDALVAYRNIEIGCVNGRQRRAATDCNPVDVRLHRG